MPEFLTGSCLAGALPELMPASWFSSVGLRGGNTSAAAPGLVATSGFGRPEREENDRVMRDGIMMLAVLLEDAVLEIDTGTIQPQGGL